MEPTKLRTTQERNTQQETSREAAHACCSLQRTMHNIAHLLDLLDLSRPGLRLSTPLRCQPLRPVARRLSAGLGPAGLCGSVLGLCPHGSVRGCRDRADADFAGGTCVSGQATVQRGLRPAMLGMQEVRHRPSSCREPLCGQQGHASTLAALRPHMHTTGDTSALALVRARRAAAAARCEPLFFTPAISSSVGEDTVTMRLLPRLGKRLRPGGPRVVSLHVPPHRRVLGVRSVVSRSMRRHVTSVLTSHSEDCMAAGTEPCLRSRAISACNAFVLLLTGLHGALTGTTIGRVGEVAGGGKEPARYWSR